MRRIWVICGLLSLTGYGLFLAAYARGFASGADNSGYMNGARLFLSGRLREPLRVPEGLGGVLRPQLFTPLGLHLQPSRDTLVPAYPPGLSLQQALLALACGSLEKAAILVNVLGGVGFVFLGYRLARNLKLSRPTAAAVSGLLAVNPLSLRFFTWNMSDGPAAFWALAAVFFACKARRKRRYAVFSGLAWAVGVATRPTNLLLFPALAFCLPGEMASAAAFGVGAVPVLAALGWYNSEQYGAWYRSGYGNLAREFKLRYFVPTLAHYGTWFARFLSPLAAIPLLAHWRSLWVRKFPHLLFALWYLPFFVFYGFYKYTNDTWWYLRFVLPTLPALVLALAVAGQELWQEGHWRFWRLGLTGLWVATFASSLFWNFQLHAPQLAATEKIYREGVVFIDQHLDPQAVLFCGQLSGSVYFYSSRALVRADLIGKAELASLLKHLKGHQGHAYALLYSREAQIYPRIFPEFYRKLEEKGPLSLWELAPSRE